MARSPDPVPSYLLRLTFGPVNFAADPRPAREQVGARRDQVGGIDVRRVGQRATNAVDRNPGVVR